MRFDCRELVINPSYILPYIYVIFVFIYLIMYIGQVYMLPFFSSDIRMYIMIALCIYTIGKGVWNTLKRNQIPKFVLAMWFYLITAVFLMVLHNRVSGANAINELFVPILALSSYYVFSSTHNPDSLNKCVNFQLGVLLVFFALFMYATYILSMRYGIYINSCYFTALLIPFALLQPHKVNKIIGIVLCMLPSVIVAKRGPFLAVSVTASVYYILSNNFFSNSQNGLLKKIIRVLSLALIIAIGYYILSEIDTQILSRLSTMVDDGGSGRTDNIEGVLEGIKNNSFYEHIIGHGAFTSFSMIGYAAHNDFIEMYWSYGALGLIVYINIFVQLVLNVKSLEGEHRTVYISSIVLFFLCSLVTQLIFVPSYVANICLFWGIILGFNNNQFVRGGKYMLVLERNS